MSTGGDGMGAPAASAPARRGRWLLVALAALVLALVGLRLLLQPDRVAGLVIDRAGQALGLEIRASGPAEYTLGRTPTLVLRGLVAREPGADAPLLRADRLSIALPWSTLRARGRSLDATRLELDAPVLQLQALRHWLDTRPPSAKRLPALSRGLAIRDGEVRGAGWTLERLRIEVPTLRPDAPLRARVSGRYQGGSLRVAAALAATLVRPQAWVDGARSGAAVAGALQATPGDDAWRLPGRVLLSGVVDFGAPALRIAPLRAGLAARYEAGTTRLPFAFGARGRLLGGGALRFERATLVLHGRGEEDSDPVPAVVAHGAIAAGADSGADLSIRLDGRLARWPQAWPGLPPPLSADTGPLAFSLRYEGAGDLGSPLAVGVHRGSTDARARLRLRELLAWTAADPATRSPLPPLDGHLETDSLLVSGATLQGVSVDITNRERADDGP